MLTCYESDLLVGVAPMYVSRQKNILGLGKQLAFVGSGEPEASETCAEYTDVLCAPQWQSKCMHGLIEALSLDWQISSVLLARMLPDRAAAFRASLTGSMPYLRSHSAGYRYRLRIDDPSRPLGLSAKMRSSLRRKRRKIEALSGVEIRWSVDEESALLNYEALAELHTRRWNSAGKPGAFATPQFMDFHRELVLESLPRNRLLLFSILERGSPLAVHYCLSEGDTAFFYQSGIDLGRFADLSAGNVCHLLAIEESMRRGLKYYDFMAGGENSYKTRFTARDDQPLVTTSYYRNGLSRYFLPVLKRIMS
ncbi:MAG: GNAT family N-acetyltransferase [Pseudomonadota bacterium]